MKTNKSSLQFLLTLPLLLLACSSSILAAEGGAHAGNGGGGVQRDGRYMTFYTAGLYVEPQANTKVEIPSLDDLMKFVSSMSFISEYSKTPILNAILPSNQHEYYTVDSKLFDQATISRLKAEFKRVTGQPVRDIALYALTDTEKRQTFLLPAYFSLSSKDQAAILFHEAYWLLHPRTTYNEVVSAEMAFEAVLDQSNNQARIVDLMSYISSPGDRYTYAVNTDVASGALGELVNEKGQIPLQTLLGDQFLRCLISSRDSIYSNPQCTMLFNLSLAKLASEHPNSALIRYMRSCAPSLPTQGPQIYFGDSLIWLKPEQDAVTLEPKADSEFSERVSLPISGPDDKEWHRHLRLYICQ